MIVCLVMLHLAGIRQPEFETRVETAAECSQIAATFRAQGFGVFTEIFGRPKK